MIYERDRLRLGDCLGHCTSPLVHGQKLLLTVTLLAVDISSFEGLIGKIRTNQQVHPFDLFCMAFSFWASSLPSSPPPRGFFSSSTPGDPCFFPDIVKGLQSEGENAGVCTLANFGLVSFLELATTYVVVIVTIRRCGCQSCCCRVVLAVQASSIPAALVVIMIVTLVAMVTVGIGVVWWWVIVIVDGFKNIPNPPLTVVHPCGSSRRHGCCIGGTGVVWW